MAGSRFAYVRNFELPDPLLPSTFFVIRLDGKGFHGFSKAHNFDKPNDVKALNLMNEAAKRVMGGRELNGECVMAYGESDEYSFVFKRSCKLHGRRSSKLITLVTSVFTAAYVALWSTFFPNSPLDLEHLPVFDGRVVQYTSETEVRDYMRWRQVDTHINNLYNTCFWALVLQGGRTEFEANKDLSGTISSQKQEMLFSRFSINYNTLDPMFRKGSLIMWYTATITADELSSTSTESNPVATASDEPPRLSNTPEGVHLRHRKPDAPKKKGKRKLIVVHEDFIADEWWNEGRGKGVLDD
ncbi:hypothetical protein JCM11641_007407 [Rhodosporidiobolus odoratus]